MSALLVVVVGCRSPQPTLASLSGESNAASMHQLKSSSSLAADPGACTFSASSIDPRYATTWWSSRRFVFYQAAVSARSKIRGIEAG